MLKRLMLGLTAVAMLTSAIAVSADRLSPQERKDGFYRVFNGKDLDGLTVMGSPSWTAAKDGVLHCSGDGHGWIRTNDIYKDFVLRLEYKISKGGNSGMFVRSGLEGDPAFSGMELQILDDYGKPADPHTSCALYDALAPTKNMSKPANEWNTVEIGLQAGHLWVIHNGEKVIDTEIYSDELNGKLADGRKITKRLKTGYIGFQNHGSEVELRNIRMKELD